jgi:hypothetical protein
MFLASDEEKKTNKQKNTTLSEQFQSQLLVFWYRSLNVNEENVPSFTSKYTMLAIIL